MIYSSHYYSAEDILLIWLLWWNMSPILALNLYTEKENKEGVTKIKKMPLQIYFPEWILNIIVMMLLTTQDTHIEHQSTWPGLGLFLFHKWGKKKGWKIVFINTVAGMKIIKLHNYNTFTKFYRSNLIYFNTN